MVLIQHHLAFHYVEDNGRTHYQANGETAYNIVFRYGKLARIVEERMGSASAEVLMNVVLLGHARASDLEYALDLRARPKKGYLQAEALADEDVTNGDTIANGDTDHVSALKPKTDINSVPQLHNILDSLLGAGFLKKVVKYQFVPDCDQTIEAERIVLAGSYQQGLKGNKQKAEFLADVNKLKRNWRDLADNYERQAHDYEYEESTKRVKLNGNTMNGVNGYSGRAYSNEIDDGMRISVSEACHCRDARS